MWNLRMVNFDKLWGLKAVLKFLTHEELVSIRHTCEELVRLFSGVKIGTDSSNIWRIGTNFSHLNFWRLRTGKYSSHMTACYVGCEELVPIPLKYMCKELILIDITWKEFVPIHITCEKLETIYLACDIGFVAPYMCILDTNWYKIFTHEKNWY